MADKSFAILLFFLLCFSAKAQDPIFSQFYNAPLQLNPAFAGNTYAPKFAVNYRNQWPSLPTAYATYSFSYDQYFNNINSGFGLFILSDDAGKGLLKTNKIGAVYAYRLKLDNDIFAKFGVEAAVVQSRYNWNKFIFPDQLSDESGIITPGGSTLEIAPENEKAGYFDLSMGVMAYTPTVYAGITLKHLNTPDQSILETNNNLQNGLPIRISLHAGAQIGVFEKRNEFYRTFISPSVLYVKQGGFSQIVAGSYFGFNALFLGVYYRHTSSNSDATIFTTGFQKGSFKIGYSFDMTISSLSIRTGGSHEIGIVVNLENSPLFPKESKYNDCFQIFR